MKCDILLISSLLGLMCISTESKPICGHGHSFTNCADLVDAAIVDVNLYYDNHLCHTMLNINCDEHHINGDEVLCGNDGKTYANHCLFTVARCEHMLNEHFHMTIANVGACPATAAPATQGPTNAGTQPATMIVVTGSGSSVQPSVSPIVTTPDPVHGVIANTFCQQVGNVDCNTGFNVVCGSDGQFYPNDCELSKAKCVDSTLTKVSFSSCSA